MNSFWLPLLFAAAAGSALAQAPSVTAVVNGLSFGLELSPGVAAAIYGTNFGTDATKVSVAVGGKTAPIINSAVTANQFAIQIPFEHSTGATSVVVIVNGAASAAFPITLLATSPAFLTATGANTGFASVYPASGPNAAVPITQKAPAKPGDVLIAYATGLGQTNPPTATGKAAATAPLAALPTLTIGGVNATVQFAGIAQGAEGVYQINFTVPSGVQGTQPLVITAGGLNSSTKITLATIGVSSLVNNASFANPGVAAPGSIMTLFVNSLGTTTDSGLAPNPTLFPSTVKTGVQVTFNGTAAPLFDIYASGNQQQVDLIIPGELPASGSVNLQLTTSSAFYPNYTVKMVSANPGLYRINDPKTSTAYITAQFANSAWLALPASTTTTLGLPTCSSSISKLSLCGQPATIGDYLVIYLTGLGAATAGGNASGKTLPTGSAPPADGSTLYQTPTLPTVTIGGAPASVLYSGLAPGFAGLYQVDVQVPSGIASGDSVPVVVTMLGASDTAAISIQPRAQ